MPPRRHPSEFIRDITLADDGIRPVRNAHSWTRDKLGVLRSYCEAYARACGSAGEFYFVDAMAGPGLYFIEETNEWLAGSTLIALRTEPTFAKCLSLNIHRGSHDALSQRVAEYGTRAVTTNADANRDLARLLLEHIPRNKPSFVLLDPEGAELEWRTVVDVSAHRQDARHGRKTEMLILFATEGINRMMPVEQSVELHNEWRLDLLFPPGTDWRGVLDSRRRGEIQPGIASQRYLDVYRKGLEDLGYKKVLAREIRRPQGGLVYHLLFATDHPAGERIMSYVFATMQANRIQMDFDFGD